MDWVVENWIWIVLGAAFILMHVFGHGGHRSHRHPDKHSEHRD